MTSEYRRNEDPSELTYSLWDIPGLSTPVLPKFSRILFDREKCENYPLNNMY